MTIDSGKLIAYAANHEMQQLIQYLWWCATLLIIISGKKKKRKEKKFWRGFFFFKDERFLWVSCFSKHGKELLKVLDTVTMGLSSVPWWNKKVHKDS